jgi:hypothetical protein
MTTAAGFGRLVEVQGEVKEEATPMHAPVVGKEGNKLFTVEEIEKHVTPIIMMFGSMSKIGYMTVLST